MGRNKSPVDELVDGMDAIGSILDENLPQIKSRIDELNERQRNSNLDINEIRRNLKEVDEASSDVQKSVTNLDIRLEEVLANITALARRLDQLQKSVLDLTDQMEQGHPDTELADTVKVLEDRLKRLEGQKTGYNDISGRF